MRRRAACAVSAKAVPPKESSPEHAGRGGARLPLDNAAHLFSAIASRRATSTYRISVTLREAVDPGALQQALDGVLPGFAPFCVRMRRGFFWRSFEHNSRPAPRVKAEQGSPCRFIRRGESNGYLFRVLYHERRIHLEVFHALADGTGSFAFLNALVARYLRILRPQAAGACGGAAVTAASCEDSYLKHFQKTMTNLHPAERAFRIRGKTLPRRALCVTYVHLDLPQLKRLCGRLGLTVNEYLVSVYLWSICTEYLHGAPSARPIRIAVPVNLRPYFASETLRNFFSFIYAAFRPQREGCTFEEVCRTVQSSLRQQLTPRHLRSVFSYSVTCQVHPVLKWLPLPVKEGILRFGFRRTALANTSTVSNTGVIEPDASCRPFIEQFSAFLPVSKGQHIKGVFCSYEDKLVFTFSYDLAQTALPEAFSRKLAADGLCVRVERGGAH